MDILEDLRTTTFSNNEAFFKKAACEIEQLRTENAALKAQVKDAAGEMLLSAMHLADKNTAITLLKEQVAQLKSSVQHEADCVDSAAEEINRQSAENDKFKDTIAQQADVIEQMREALRHYAYRAGQDWQIAREALALQPSPEILQARDERVAEACAQYVYAMGCAKGSVLLAERLLSGEWRRYL